jgi:aminoglycoside/choline kinase family phosphotransferase
MAQGTVRAFAASAPGTEGTYTFCGLHLVSPRLLERLPAGRASSVIDAYSRAMRQGETIAGVCVPGAFWADIGTPSGYLEAHRELQRRGHETCRAQSRLRRAGVTIRGFASAGRHVVVGNDVVLTDTVLMDGAVVASGTRLIDAVVGPNVRIAGIGTGIIIRADKADDPDVLGPLRALGWAPDRTSVSPLPPRGSDRTFTRLIRGKRRAMAVRYSAGRPENARYAANTRFLKRIGIPVPDILFESPRERWLLLQDLGDTCLRDLVAGASPGRIRQLYRKVLDPVAILHTRGTRNARRTALELEKPFGPALFRWEHTYFEEHFLRKRLSLPQRQRAAICRELAKVSRRLHREPAVLLHRDLQSDNVLMPGGRPFFIDFQGMRFGPAVYDLASLLCDPYVGLDATLQEDLLAYYAQKTGGDAGQLREVFWCAAVQRLVQALGAYARLGSRPDTARFAAYIRPGLDMLSRALEHIDKCLHLRHTVHNVRSVEGQT